MDLQLKDKVAIVTGSARGIGKAIAVKLAEEGVHVVVNSRTQTQVDTTVYELLRYGVRCIGIAGDVSQEADVKRLIDSAVEAFGRLDIMVNNAGVFLAKPVLEMSSDEWDRVMNINLRGTFLGCQAAAKVMVEQKSGVILNISAFSGLLPNLGTGAYAASKAAVINLTKVLAAELAPYGIRVNALAPGATESEMVKELKHKKSEAMNRQISLHRFGQPEEIANLAAFVLSPLASYVDGVTFDISGGKFAVQDPGEAWLTVTDK